MPWHYPPRDNARPGLPLGFWRGLLIAIPFSLILWALLIAGARVGIAFVGAALAQ